MRYISYLFSQETLEQSMDETLKGYII